jgi:NAD(P)-dependent dehydrogenase (short-subunit alcohol dehydrogenase family)
VVTGSTSGIGIEVARRLHADGLAVVLTGRDQRRGREVERGLGTNVRFVKADLTDAEAAATLMDTALDTFGRIDVVVNNAAMDHTGDLLDVPRQDIRTVFEINTLAAIAVLQEGAKRMEHGGAVVNVSSRLASIGVPTMGVYAASKGALLALTRSAAVELAPRNIRVNAVAPGMTRTPLYDAWLASTEDPVATEQAVIADIPLGRVATSTDVASAISFLASEDAAYITGVSIAVDGGYTAR